MSLVYSIGSGEYCRCINLHQNYDQTIKTSWNRMAVCILATVHTTKCDSRECRSVWNENDWRNERKHKTKQLDAIIHAQISWINPKCPPGHWYGWLQEICYIFGIFMCHAFIDAEHRIAEHWFATLALGQQNSSPNKETSSSICLETWWSSIYNAADPKNSFSIRQVETFISSFWC